MQLSGEWQTPLGEKLPLAILLCELSSPKEVGHGVVSTEGIFGGLCLLEFGPQRRDTFLGMVLLLAGRVWLDISQNVK